MQRPIAGEYLPVGRILTGRTKGRGVLLCGRWSTAGSTASSFGVFGGGRTLSPFYRSGNGFDGGTVKVESRGVGRSMWIPISQRADL